MSKGRKILIGVLTLTGTLALECEYILAGTTFIIVAGILVALHFYEN